MSAHIDDENVPRTPERATRACAQDAAARARIDDTMGEHRVGDAFVSGGDDVTRFGRVEAREMDGGSSESDVTAGGAVTAQDLAEVESFLETLDALPTDVELGEGDAGFLEECLGSLSGWDGSGREESACGDARVGTAASDDGASSSRAKASSQTNSGLSEEERRLRLSRNRESAQNSRARKKEYVSDLEKRARALEQQNSELQAMVINLTHENHALRLSLQSAGFTVPSMMMPCTPKLPLPPIDAHEDEPLVPSSPSQLEVKKPASKRRRQTAVASATALVLGAMSVVGLVTPGSQPTMNRHPMQSTGRRLLAIQGPPVEDQLVRMGMNITSLQEEIALNDDERSFSLPAGLTSDGVALWGDTTSDGRSVNVRKPEDVNDPWFSAFNSAGMHNHVNLLSRVACKELFKFKGTSESGVVARAAESEVWERDYEKVERRRNSGAIPMPPSSNENVTSVAREAGDENSIVSVLLPPPIEGVMQQLNKLFVVTFNKRTADYTTHSCLMPQPMTSAHRHV